MPDAASSGIAETSFDPAVIPAAHHLDVWRKASECAAHVDSLESRWQFLGLTSNWYTNGLVFSHTHCSATRYQRSSQHIRQGDSDCIVLKLQLSGTQKGLFGDFDHFDCQPGSLVLQDWSMPYTAVTSAYEVRSVSIPRYLLRGSHLMHRRSPVIVWNADSPQARLLAPALGGAFASLQEDNREALNTYSAGIIGLLDGMLIGDRTLLQKKYHERDRFENMRQFLARNLANPALGADQLCQHFHCSRATVYRLFQQEGGVAAFILRQRLQRCMQELTRVGTLQKGLLDVLAQSWGFTSRQNLTRHFKTHYGMTPQQAADALRRSRQAQTTHGDASYWSDARRVTQWFSGREQKLDRQIS